MAKSTWWSITHGMREATDRAYKRKSKKQKNRQEVQEVWNNFDRFCIETEKEIFKGIYQIGNYRHYILKDKNKLRYISVLPFKDRCVQNAVKESFEVLVLKQMTDDMFGGLPGRGILALDKRYCVIKRMKKILMNPKLKYYIQGDISKFYDNIDKIVSIRLLERYITDYRTLSIIKQHLFKQKKLAIGDPFSHLISNLVMSQIIRKLKEIFRNKIQIVNFADDIFIAAENKNILKRVRIVMKESAINLRLHYKKLYIKPFPTGKYDSVNFCGMKYLRDTVLLCQSTKKRYIKSRHKFRSMGSYNGILQQCDSKYLRKMVEFNDNKHMGNKIRRPFAGAVKKIEQLEGIKHTVVDVIEKPSRQNHSDSYFHVQAIADGLGLIVYSTSSKKLVDYLKTHQVPMRDLIIVKDWSGFYYKGTVYTDEEEEQMIRAKYNIY